MLIRPTYALLHGRRLDPHYRYFSDVMTYDGRSRRMREEGVMKGAGIVTAAPLMFPLPPPQYTLHVKGRAASGSVIEHGSIRIDRIDANF